MKELLKLGMVVDICWVSTNDQFADCLTKKGSPNKADWLLAVASSNKL